MAKKKNKGTFIIDEAITKQQREDIDEKVQKSIAGMKDEISEREPIIAKRQDFFNGNHKRWTNVQSQTGNQQDGHIQVTVNYIYRFVTKIHQALTNTPPRIKVKPLDESDEIETARAEAVETAIYKVLQDKKFFQVIFKRTSLNQIRDGDFALGCFVEEDDQDGREIEIQWAEDLTKIGVLWDDAAGMSYSGIVFRDMWSLTKIKREFGYDAESYNGDTDATNSSTDRGDHLKDQYGLFADGSTQGKNPAPSGNTKSAKAEVINYWGYELVDIKNKKGKTNKEMKVVNMMYINRELKQIVATDYEDIPWFIGHSFITAGRPWSMSFIDNLIDPQIELNDRTGEEGDLVRVGSHMKFLAVNMADFDQSSIKPGKGQVIFIEGENVDFKPLNMNVTTFPSDTYLNRMSDNLFNLGIPRIALASGSAPYTGRVAATQYQPFVDLVTDLRVQWEIVLNDLIRMMQQYFIDYFPDMAPIMAERIEDPQTGEMIDGAPSIRDIEFDWENVLPLSRSDKVVDASTLFDRGVLPITTYLEEAGFRNPGEIVKALKKERSDPDLMAIKEKFSQYSQGAQTLQLQAQKGQEQQAEQAAITQGQIQQAKQPAAKPILNSSQNDGRRGIPSGVGTPTGQTATAKGAIAQTTQNMNAQNGV